MKPMSAYGVVHYLLRQVNGPAREHWCVECGLPAVHWAYDHQDVFERFDPETHQIFCVNFDHYQPMCGRCHQALDAENASRVAKALKKALAEIATDAA